MDQQAYAILLLKSTSNRQMLPLNCNIYVCASCQSGQLKSTKHFKLLPFTMSYKIDERPCIEIAIMPTAGKNVSDPKTPEGEAWRRGFAARTEPGRHGFFNRISFGLVKDDPDTTLLLVGKKRSLARLDYS